METNDYQGKRQDQIDGSEKIGGFVVIAVILIVIILIIFK